MAITSTDSFLTLLEKSQLLSAKDLEKVRAAAGKYNDAKALARALVAAKGLTRWQAGQLLAGRSSFTLGKFRLIDLLGRGGMGSVFAAEHMTMGRRVALKIISKQTGRDPEQLERFLNEARRIAALDHPNIVRAFDVDHEGERYFLVLEHVDGRDLQQIVESDGPLDVERAVRFIRQAALGLAHAHDRKMIHCDIKPANLIVGDDQVVKILDMGMARLVESDGSSSDSNENIVGTIDYIAPEQALEAEDLDHRVDIYSLGCTLYFLLTSRPPFGEGTLAQRIMKHQTQDPRPISETRSGVPDGLADVCSKMMAKKPEDRFQTAAEVAQRLERWIGGEGTPVVTQAAASPLSETMPALPQGKGKPALNNDDVDDHDETEIDDGPAIVELIGDDDTPEDGDDGEVKIAVADSGSFSVRAGASRGGRLAAAKKAAPEADVSEESAGFFADPRKKWATIILAGAVLLGSVVGVSAWMLLGGDETQDAALDDQVASAEAVPTTASPEPDDGMKLDGDPDDDLAGMFGQDDKEPAEETSTDNMQESAVVPTSEAEKTPEPDQADATTAKPDTKEPTESTSDTPGKNGGEMAKPSEAPAKSAEEKKPTENKEPEKKPEPKKEAPKVEPFKDFPNAVSIPVLNDKDPSGEGSKAPSTLGTIQGPADVNWQMLLLGGDQALKGDRKFVLARTDSDASKAAWSMQVEGSSSDGGQEKVARLWREEKDLKFQFQEGADDAVANNLRNCILQVRVAGESRYLALTEPIQAKPLEIDVMRGQINGTVPIKWAPDDDLLRFKFSKIEGFPKMNFEPAEPVAPKTPVLMNFVYTDSHENDTNAVTFQIRTTSKKTSLTVNLQLMKPTSRNFQQLAGNRNEMQLEVQINRLGSDSSALQKKMRDLKGEEANKVTRQIDTISGQIWYYEFLLKAHKKAFLHYQVVADVGGQELVLVTTK